MTRQEIRADDEPFPFDPRITTLTIKMIEDIAGLNPFGSSVLDIGCGFGRLVASLREAGVDAQGCDVDYFWDGDRSDLRKIELNPYRLPYENEQFDVVVTNTILEHVHNHKELYLEIYRVLKPGGCAIHIMPGRWFLRLGRWFMPVEPHIRVPMVHFIWPRPGENSVPRWWFLLWATLGFRSPYQHKKSVSEVVESNVLYCSNNLCYLPHAEHVSLSKDVFGNCSYPMDYFLRNAYGGASGLYRKLWPKALLAWVFKHIRIALMVQRKEAR